MGNNPAFNDEAAHAQVDKSHSYHRPRYGETMDAMGYLRNLHAEVGHAIVNTVPASQERSLALTALDECNMWAIAGLARHEPQGEEPNTTSHPLPPVLPGGGVGKEFTEVQER